MSSDTAEFYNAEDGDGYSSSEIDLVNDMPALGDSSSELPTTQVTTTATKRSHSKVSASKSWVWNYFKKADASHCVCTLSNKKVNYSSTKSTGSLARHIKRIHKFAWE
jgi:hypothetical protein